MPFSQEAFEVRYEWGAKGIAALVPSCDAIISCLEGTKSPEASAARAGSA